MAKVFQLYVEVLSWHDGDSFYGVVDQAFREYRGREAKPVLCRSWGIDAPELRVERQPNPAGEAAHVYAQGLAPPGEYPCLSYPPEQDNFGRPLLDLILPDGRFFSGAMITAGQADPYKG